MYTASPRPLFPWSSLITDSMIPNWWGFPAFGNNKTVLRSRTTKTSFWLSLATSNLHVAFLALSLLEVGETLLSHSRCWGNPCGMQASRAPLLAGPGPLVLPIICFKWMHYWVSPMETYWELMELIPKNDVFHTDGCSFSIPYKSSCNQSCWGWRRDSAVQQLGKPEYWFFFPLARLLRRQSHVQKL